MTTSADIAWGRYQAYEGPFFRGTTRYTMPTKPTENHRRMAVLTATEGGRADAINMYDRCIVSVGFIQFCEAKYFLTSGLLGAIAEKDPTLLQPLSPALGASGADFVKTPRGRWRFQFHDGRGEVDTGQEQEQLFLLHSNGHRGTWDEESRVHAKLWAACLANMLSQPAAVETQVNYVASRMTMFAMPEAKQILFKDPATNDGWVGAMRAGFLSFAGNLPAVANKHLKIALQSAPGAKWSKDWCVHVLKELTFGPKIAIYPQRYNAIRPVLEHLYGVDLPDMAKELEEWKAHFDAEVEVPASKEEPDFTDPPQIQAFLMAMGYDLGPAGADGILGRKTKEALRTFQSLHGLVDDGIVGPKTRAELLKAYRAQVCT